MLWQLLTEAQVTVQDFSWEGLSVTSSPCSLGYSLVQRQGSGL